MGITWLESGLEWWNRRWNGQWDVQLVAPLYCRFFPRFQISEESPLSQARPLATIQSAFMEVY